MANKTKKSSKQDDGNVVRIKATSSPATKRTDKAEKATVVSAKADKPAKEKKQRAAKPGIRTPRGLKLVGGYFKGAWVELRQVRWPNRRATWGLTGAVIVYSAFFVVFVLLLDAGFKYLFELILGK